MQKIQKPNPAKVHIKPLMMPIMLPSRAVEEVKAAVDGRRLDQLPRQEGPHG